MVLYMYLNGSVPFEAGEFQQPFSRQIAYKNEPIKSNIISLPEFTPAYFEL